eukprot:TRINITY_DN940_c0_g1_i1.p2 TRINITY_DN940_c0_g1~~TRINITY_DN940_c0_g1_i1.p2  ORF type:complete len:341 (+),score=130.95 TRINITY_DN940_c0_g1_i1:52-1074(+)
MTTQAWKYTAHPQGIPTKECFTMEDIPAPKEEDLKDGELLLKMVALSVDPYMRGRMTAEVKKGYIPSFSLGDTMTGGVACEVLASKCEGFVKGDFVTGFLPFQKLMIAPGKGINKAYPSEDIPLTYFLGTLGLTGLSAYLPIEKIGKPKKGETVFVSGAAGAVGSAAIQIFKLHGCTVVGSAGSDEKVKEVLNAGADAAFNYRTVKDEDLVGKLKELCPNGIDVYFDNVGGVTLEAALEVMNTHSRIIACGAISQYNLPHSERYGIKNTFNIITKCITFQGFIVSQWSEEFPRVIMTLMEHVKKGEIKVNETRAEGFENMPAAMEGLFTGNNTGKTIVMA